MKKTLPILLIATFLTQKCGEKVKVQYDDFDKKIDDSDFELPDLEKYLGYKKIGVVAKEQNQPLYGKEVYQTVRDWTYDYDKSKIGSKYFNVKGVIQMGSSSHFDATKLSLAINSYDFKTAVAILQGTLIYNASLASGTPNKVITTPTGISPSDIFTDEFVSKIYITLNDKTRSTLTFSDIKSAIKINAKYQPAFGEITFADMSDSIKLVPNSNGDAVLAGYQPFSTWLSDTKYKEYTKEALTSKKLGLAQKSLDLLFIQVEDEIHNSEKVYKALKEDKIFEDEDLDTHIVLIGDKAKYQSGAKSKTFAGDKISTASYSKYASAWMSGYHSAILQLKWSKSEQVFEETDVVYLIGAISESKSKKMAFAFRKGVEAAAANKDFSKYLNVKFVSKNEDNSKSSKKLYREISSWKEREKSKSKLYEFTSSDTFSDSPNRVIYIAGATAKDWRGTSTNIKANTWNRQDDTGLIGAMFNFKPPSSADQSSESLSSKTFNGRVSIILDNKITLDSGKDDIAADNTKIEYKNVKVLGSIGNQSKAIELYVENIIAGLWFEKEDKWLEKHSVFGYGLTLNEKIMWNDWKLRERNRKYIDALSDASKAAPIDEESLVKIGAWL